MSCVFVFHFKKNDFHKLFAVKKSDLQS